MSHHPFEFTSLFIFLSLITGLFLFSVYEHWIWPLFESKAEIDRLADEMIRHHGDRAEYFVSLIQEHERLYSHHYEWGKWQRVRREIRRRLAAAKAAEPDGGLKE